MLHPFPPYLPGVPTSQPEIIVVQKLGHTLGSTPESPPAGTPCLTTGQRQFLVGHYFFFDYFFGHYRGIL